MDTESRRIVRTQFVVLFPFIKVSTTLINLPKSLNLKS